MSKVIRSNDELNALANGKNLVVNGDFSFGTGGWEAYNSELNIVSGDLEITDKGSGAAAQQANAVIQGTTYEIEIDVILGTASNGANISIFNGSSTDITYTNQGAGSYIYTYVATTTILELKIANAGGVADETVLVDNISVKEIPQVQGENLPDYVASRISGGKILQVLKQDAAKQTGTTTIPHDTSTPLITEGTEVATLTITPEATSSKVKVEFAPNTGQDNGGAVAIAVFRGSICIFATTRGHVNNFEMHQTIVDLVDEPSTTSATTYSIRAGNAGSGTWRIGQSNDDKFSAVSAGNNFTLSEIGV